MMDLKQAHDDINAAWQFYKKYAIREPKDDAYYHDMSHEIERCCSSSRLGKALRVAILTALSGKEGEV